MNYVRASNAILRGYVLTREGWINGELVEKSDQFISGVAKRKFVGRGYREVEYWPTTEDLFADDWGLVT